MDAIATGWLVDNSQGHSRYILLIQLNVIIHWLSTLPINSLESLLVSGASTLNGARDRDILLGLMTSCLRLGLRRIIVPSCLVLDECSRLYILELMMKAEVARKLETVVFECYTNNMVRYMSDTERELVCRVVRALDNVRLLSLQAVASNDLGNIDTKQTEESLSTITFRLHLNLNVGKCATIDLCTFSLGPSQRLSPAPRSRSQQ